jgi:hypothetical protein
VVTRLRGKLLFAVIAATAAYIVAPPATPIDRALPFVAFVLAICGDEGWSLFVLLPPIFITDEHTRLLAYGVIAAIVFAVAAWRAEDDQRLVVVVSGVLLLRWIPIADVVIWREVLILCGVIALFAASESIVVALAVAAITPAFPARWTLLPFLVAVVFAILPSIELPKWLRVPLYACAVALFAMWPWSGILARALPAFLRSEPAPAGARPVWIALAPGESVSIDTPPGARRVIMIASAANASRLRKGTLMGSVNGKPVRIGDIADFGYTRREQFMRSHTAGPQRPINDVKGYGQSAWLHTAGLIDVPSPGTALHVTAARGLPAAARLQIEAVDFE